MCNSIERREASKDFGAASTQAGDHYPVARFLSDARNLSESLQGVPLAAEQKRELLAALRKATATLAPSLSASGPERR